MYNPDDWVIVKIISDDPHYRVLCSWAGGYLDGDEWKLSSGIQSIEETDTHYIMPQHSGSVYELHKNSERMSGIMSGVWNRLTSRVVEGMGIELVSIEDLLAEFGNDVH